MAIERLDINQALRLHELQAEPDDESIEVMRSLTTRKLSVEAEQTRFAALCERWDNLYWPQWFTAGGASHWASHESARQAGRAHVSVNVYPAYVEIPASLQSVTPVENMVATGDSDSDRAIAAAVERVYMTWKDDIGFELKFHKAMITKALYGRVAAKVYWDEDAGYPQVDIIDQPKNLYLGWRNSNYSSLEWAIYAYTITPATALEDWGLSIEEGVDAKGDPYPYVVAPSDIRQAHPAVLNLQSDLKVEVYDYWYRRPRKNTRVEMGKPVKFETWNAIFVGNVMVKNKEHREYRGTLPYIPLFNSYIPGVPDGRPELWDIEQLIREKDEKLSEMSQMQSKAINGQYWQLTGADAPASVPAGLKPTPNTVIAPGAGNRIEALQPWMPTFQAEQYLARLDRELNDASGLNDLLRGMAPTQTLNSGKAISALVANYETRVTMKRDLAYAWRGDKGIWGLAATIWAEKNTKLKPVIEGKAKLKTINPNLTPRDDAETSTIAANMVVSKLWSVKRGMDRTGIDDPETELDIIREERTDATLFPAEVQVLAQLLGVLKAQGIVPPEAAQNAAMTQGQQLSDVRALSGGQQGQPMMNGEGEQPMTPPELMPGNTPEGQALDPNAPAPGAEDLTLQTAIRGGEAQSRILQQERITQQPQGGG